MPEQLMLPLSQGQDAEQLVEDHGSEIKKALREAYITYLESQDHQGGKHGRKDQLKSSQP